MRARTVAAHAELCRAIHALLIYSAWPGTILARVYTAQSFTGPSRL